MKKWVLICCLVVLGAALLCLTGCDEAKESEKLLSEIQYYGLPAEAPNRGISDFLDCSAIPENSRGELTVLGFQVGKTTFQEMVEVLQPAKIFWFTYSGHLVFEEGGDNQWRYVSACYLDGQLSAIQTRGLNEYPDTIEGFVEEFGIPDLITWAGDIEERIAVWVEIGLIGNFAGGAGESKQVILVPPMELSDFEGSWLAERIQYTPDYYAQNIKYTGEYYYLEMGGTNWYIREDPWGYTMNK